MKKILLPVLLAFASLLNVMAWETNPAVNDQITEDGKDIYAYSIKTNKNGTTFIYFQNPSVNGQTMRLQILDKDGKAKYDKEGLVISNERALSYTKVNQTMMVDQDGYAIIAVSDCRKGIDLESYTIYKVSEEGETIWSTTLNDGTPHGGTACMNMTSTLDGGYIFAYMVFAYNDMPSYIQMQKLDKDGKSKWIKQIYKENTALSYPYMVDAGDNQALLLYASGASYDIYCRLVDIDGTPADDDILVTRGAFGSIPALQTAINVEQGPDGSAWMGWRSIDPSADLYENHLAWIKNDLTFGFVSGQGGTIISNDTDLSRDMPHFYYDKDDEAIYCVFRVFNQAAQEFKGLYMQKIGLDGDLKWGPYGKPIIEVQNTDQYQSVSVQDAGNGKIAVFYQHMAGLSNNGKVDNLIAIYDKDGNLVQSPVDFGTSNTVKNDLQTSPLIDGDHYLTWWTVSKGMDKRTLFMQRVYVNGKTTAVEEIFNVADQQQGYFDLSGKYSASPVKGINIHNGRKIINHD